MALAELTVNRSGNRISVKGALTLATYPRLTAALYQAKQEGLNDLHLDFGECERVRAGAVVAVYAQIIALRNQGSQFSVDLPTVHKLNTLFRNSNWAHILYPNKFPQSSFSGYRHVPATQFASPAEQQAAVNSILDVLLGSLTGIKRADFAAIEWALNEITDNVLTHARAETGGLVQVTTFEKTSRRVEFVVCDAGATIPATLRETHAEINSDTQALERAIREGITRDKSVGQGNGLFGTFQVCQLSRGSFDVHSRYANLSYDDHRGLHVKTEQIPYSGTLVVAMVDCSRPGVLQEALRFGGTRYVPTDRIETKYETSSDGNVSFNMIDETPSFGSRPAGEPLRKKLANLAEMCSDHKIIVDFAGVPLVSSSFADEVFGKLFVELGPIRFMQTFQFTNISPIVQNLIDKAITQRVGGK